MPTRGLKKLGLAETFFDRSNHHHDSSIRDAQSLSCLLASDINLFYALAGREAISMTETIHKMQPGKWPNGRIQYPPSIVYDIDDNLDWVHPFNPTFACYGIRDAAGRLLEPGDALNTTLANGEEIELWKDKETLGEKGWLFDIERNRDFMSNLHKFASMCDGFTTPSKYLGEYLRSNYDYPEPYVFPNSIIPEDFYWPNHAPHDGVRILWQGGTSHFSDWYPLRSAMAFIAKKYPKVKFVIFGSSFAWITDVIPKEQLEFIPWRPYDAYKPMRAMMDCDINLCIVADNEFSRSKSAIKWYEGSLGPRPEATLATDCLPYNAEIVDGETGLLYAPGDPESFAANLSSLIESADLRRKLGDNAKKWVLENRHYEKTVPGLFDYYMELRARKAKEQPYVEPKRMPKTRAARKAVKARKLR